MNKAFEVWLMNGIGTILFDSIQEVINRYWNTIVYILLPNAYRGKIQYIQENCAFTQYVFS